MNGNGFYLSGFSNHLGKMFNGENKNLTQMFIPGVDRPFTQSHGAVPAPYDSSFSLFLSHILSSNWHYRLVSVLCEGTQDSVVLCFVWAGFFLLWVFSRI